MEEYNMYKYLWGNSSRGEYGMHKHMWRGRCGFGEKEYGTHLYTLGEKRREVVCTCLFLPKPVSVSQLVFGTVLPCTRPDDCTHTLPVKTVGDK
jgi:hypothetical protein